ncbi:MAG: hypothetical protein BJ554DRAFT_8444 [Olpidium bornovanus]|uniref:Uncharacterized protein n=1 Tax=Olpidium bornovanus TaxID=278681 RepID=A0A8H8A2K5_9FUNG|nr:MAG: hypothetical protein BJ554DRAFT_8444 [Olpidium bornovanus]
MSAPSRARQAVPRMARHAATPPDSAATGGGAAGGGRPPRAVPAPSPAAAAAPPPPSSPAGLGTVPGVLPDLRGGDVSQLLTVKVIRSPAAPSPQSSRRDLLGPGNTSQAAAAAPHPLSSNTGVPPPERQPSEPAAADSALPGRAGSAGVDILSLPGGLCNVYLGESFAGKFVIVNEGFPPPAAGASPLPQPASAVTPIVAVARQVALKAEVKVNNSTYPVVDTFARPLPMLGLGQSVEIPFHHEFKEIGTNILVCTVGYVFEGLGGDRQASFEKFAKFVTSSPVGVKTKFHNFTAGKVFLEIQLSNTSGAALSIRRMNFYPTDPFQYQNLNFVEPKFDPFGQHSRPAGLTPADDLLGATQGISELTLGGDQAAARAAGETGGGGDGHSPPQVSATPAVAQQPPPVDRDLTRQPVFANEYMSPGDMRQYLYLLAPKNPADMTAWLTTVVGKLDIMWRTSNSEHGRLQTAPLSRKPPALDDLEITVMRLPKRILVENQFSVDCRMCNRTPATVNLVVSAIKQKMGSVLLSGAASFQLNQVAPNAAVDFKLVFFPLLPGLHVISGLKVADLISGQTREIPVLTEVFVLHRNEDAETPS